MDHKYVLSTSIHIFNVSMLQDKVVRLINFRVSTSELYKSTNIIKFRDMVTMNNFLYVHDCFSKRIPIPLQARLKYIHETHNQFTRISKM